MIATTTTGQSKLAMALIKAQQSVLLAHKDSKNPHFKNSFASLQSVWDCIREPLTENGLAITQTFERSDTGDVVHITTTLLHESGETLSGTLTMPMLKKGPQDAGSAITYGRRYALMALVGVCPVDDDAEGATPRSNGQSQQQPPRQPQGLTEEQRITLGDMYDALSPDMQRDFNDAMKSNLGFASLDDVTASKYRSVHGALKAREGR